MNHTAQEYLSLPVPMRKRHLIDLSKDGRFEPAEGVDQEYHTTWRLARALDTFLVDFINDRIQSFVDFNNKEKRVSLVEESALASFNKILQSLHTDGNSFKSRVKTSPKNIYELGGALKLAFGNNATRSISTSLGLVWENIASISPQAVSPEIHFGVKLKGIDIIVLDDERLIYTQLKTQKNTLTGSQRGRSVNELVLHDHRQIVACFDTHASWTFNSKLVPRVCGKQFWESIGFQYSEIIDMLKKAMKMLDEEYIKLLE